MKRAISKTPVISEEEPTIGEFYTLDTFGPHAKLRPGELRECINKDIYGEYIKTRRGSERLIADRAKDFDILNYIIFDAGDKEYVIIQQDIGSHTQFEYIELTPTGTWKTVTDKSTGSVATFFPSSDQDWVADLTMSNGKVYVFQEAGNAIFEFDPTTSRFLSRKMGLPAPQITEIVGTEQGTGTPGLAGKRVYGVELVYKNTSVTPNVDIIVSGPNRAVELANPEFNEGRLAVIEGENLSNIVKISGTLNDGTDITDAENGNWTHIRLYRSKDVTTATNAVPELEGPAEIVGRFDELFLVQEWDRVAFLATLVGGEYIFDPDVIPDDNMPYPLDMVPGDRLELYPIPAATTGTFQRNRIWASGITNFPGPSGPVVLENIQSKIFFSPETYTKYSENVQALSAIESDPGDGQKMIKLLPLKEDLVGIKEGKTGIVQRGDPDAGWNTEDELIGISNKKLAQYVPNVGICAIVNDQKDFRIFGYDLNWHSTFAGIQISRPIRNIIKFWGTDDINFMYMNGKLFLNGGFTEILILNVEQQKGWGRYQYPLGTFSEAMFTFNEGKRGAIVSRDQVMVEIEIDDLETDYNTTIEEDQFVDWTITTHKWQDAGGRSIIEHRWMSLMAKLQEQISIQPYVNGRIWDNPFGVLLDPADYPDAALQETEYQGYAEIKPVGNYLHYVISGNKPATIYSIMINCLIQRGSIAPGFDPFGVLELARSVPPWASTASEYQETGVADNEIVESGGRITEIVEGQ